MPYVVQLDFGASAEPVASLCSLLDPAVESVPRLGGVPHLSLATYDDLDPVSCADRLQAFAGTFTPFSIRLAGLGTFAADMHVLFAAPVVTDRLLALHRRFNERFAPPGATCHEHYRPGAWVPHVTLAWRLSTAQLQKAIAVVAPRWTAVDVTVAGVGLIRYPPVETLFRQPLAAA